MRMSRLAALVSASLLGMTCAGCGGSGGGGPNPIPAPPPAPAPTPTPTPPASTVPVVLFTQPKVGEYASTGVWTNIGEWVGQYPTTPDKDARITSITSDGGDQPKIRYTSTGYYEIQLPGEGFGRLVHHRNVSQPTTDNTLLEVQPTPPRTIRVSGSRNEGYSYSEMLSWWRPDLDWAFTADFGEVAFGVPTPAGSMPVTGTAAYQGRIAGITDAKFNIGNSNDQFLLPVEGTVNLNFHFANGTLGGGIKLILNEGMSWRDLGDIAFNQTVFSAGSTSYSGKFDTALTGFNFFNGIFTGPNAQETIGSFAVPFRYEDQDHQAIGAWIAKRAE